MENCDHIYKYLKTESIGDAGYGKKHGRDYIIHGECIKCGKKFEWNNTTATYGISRNVDEKTGLKIISINKNEDVQEENPFSLEEIYEYIPYALTTLPNWVGWKLEERDGKPTKIPYSRTGVKASSTDPTTWRKFEEVAAISPTKEKGIGFVFDGKGIVGIDIDHCLDENGNINETFKHIPEALKSYTEISPSGMGLHIFIRCEEEPYSSGKHHGGIEVYSKGRYFTVTGNKWGNTRSQINTVTAKEVRDLLDPFVNPKPRESPTVRKTTSPNLSDEDIINILTHAKNRDKFERLWSGSAADHGNDDSAADMALATMLAFYTTDANQIERIMRQSGLLRDKWNTHQKYLREYTIAKALQLCTTHYEPTFVGDASEGKTIADKLISVNPDDVGIQAAMIIASKNAEDKSKYGWDIKYHEEEKDEENLKEIIIETRKYNKRPPFPTLPSGFLKDYMDFGERISYSTKEYHFAAILPILSMALGRRVVTKVGLMSLYPNIFSIIIGPTSISGKTFACNMAMDEFSYIVKYEEQIAKSNSVEIKTKTISEAALVQGLSDVYNQLWYFDDCRPFFEESTKWNSTMLGTLCTIYDCSKVERTLSSRGKKDGERYKWECPEPFMSLLFNTTNGDIEEVITRGLFSSGFLPRLMVFIGDGERMRENADLTLEEIETLLKLKTYVRKTRDLLYPLGNNSIVFGVCKKIERWKIDATNKKLGKNEEADRTAIARGFIHAYKLATIMTIFDADFQENNLNISKEEFPITVEIPDQYAELAIKIVEEYLIPRALDIYKMGLIQDKRNSQDKILKAIEKFGGIIRKTELGRELHLNKKSLEEALAAMVDSEEIEVYKTKTPDGGKKPTIMIKKIDHKSE